MEWISRTKFESILRVGAGKSLQNSTDDFFFPYLLGKNPTNKFETFISPPFGGMFISSVNLPKLASLSLSCDKWGKTVASY